MWMRAKGVRNSCVYARNDVETFGHILKLGCPNPRPAHVPSGCWMFPYVTATKMVMMGEICCASPPHPTPAARLGQITRCFTRRGANLKGGVPATKLVLCASFWTCARLQLPEQDQASKQHVMKLRIFAKLFKYEHTGRKPTPLIPNFKVS